MRIKFLRPTVVLCFKNHANSMSIFRILRSFRRFCHSNKIYRISVSLTAHVAPGAALIVMTYVGCDATTAIVMLNLALAMNGAACQTSLQNHQDLAPNYAGSLYGVMNTFGSFSGVIIPAIIGALTVERVRFFPLF